MRLHTLGITAFGPYAAPQHIDVDRLTASGLFLLEGPTGAGKTTILDAITFALYGGVSGDGGGIDRLHSHFASPAVEPSVTAEFSAGGVRYRIQRVPEHRRPKRRGEGFTTEASRVHLQRQAAGGWVSLSASKAEAGALVTEIIGLNREQFTQVILLPQGEFARFLHSTDDVRRDLLTKLFGTSLYDRITAELDRRRYEAARQQEQAEELVKAAVSAAAEAAGLDAAARAGILGMSRDERATRLKEVAEELATAVAAAAGTLEAAGFALAAALQADEAAKRQAALASRLAQALAGLAGHEATRPAHAERADRLAAARQAEPVRPLLAALDEARAVEEAARDALRDMTCDDDCGDLAAAAGEHAAAAAARAAAAELAAASLEPLAVREAGLPALEADVARCEDAAGTAAGLARSLEAARADLPGEIAALETQLAEARQTAAGLAAARERLFTVGRQLEAAQRLAELEPLLAGRQAAAQAAIDRHQELVDAYQRAMEARLAGMAAELASQLTEGSACPVCGSTTHPVAARACGGPVSADDLHQAQAERDAAEDARRQAEAERDEAASEVRACAAVAAGQPAATLEAETAALAGQVVRATEAGAEAATLEAGLADRRAESARVAEELLAAATAAAAAAGEARQAREQRDRLVADLSAAAQGYPSVRAGQEELRQRAAADREMAAALDRFAAAQAEHAKAASRAVREASDRGFSGPEVAAAAVLPAAEQAALADEVAAWEAALAALSAAATAPDLAGLDAERAAGLLAGAEAAAGGLAQARDAEQQARRAHEAAAGKAARFTERVAEVRDAEEASDRLAEATAAVVQLAGLAKGMDGHRRVSLTTFVLRHWFGQVVAAANIRLSAMSSGRYELKRTDEGHHKRDRGGLTLAVIDRYTGEERSPASLSGGETFYTSLALALGLADVVKAEAGGVDLDTLFIDEGFASLDAGTLDQVMAVIDELRDRGRVVGIVSHVSDLKERVPERLAVRRLPDGSSAVTVVA